jgi:hypothetical protein
MTAQDPELLEALPSGDLTDQASGPEAAEDAQGGLWRDDQLPGEGRGGECRVTQQQRNRRGQPRPPVLSGSKRHAGGLGLA